jgi:colanic acid/amylovoran biosynthesis protein
MLIEIRKAGFVNKGAALMLHAVLSKIKDVLPDAEFAMVPGQRNSSTPYTKRAELRLLQKPWKWRHGIQWGDLARLIPLKTREKYGVVLDKELDAVMDVAGFAYGDQWGVERTKELAISCIRWRKNGTKIILLPQAFGPFTSSKIRKYIQIIADNADLIYARDPISYQHFIEVTGERSNVQIAPDFTNLLCGILPKNFNPEENRFCLVPNQHMIDKTSSEMGKAYIPFMTECARYLLQQNQKPFILVHEGEKDMKIARQIVQCLDAEIPIINEDNPLYIKGIIGSCQGTLGSRFHGLVNALSQGVPALSTGWSHKYRMLFDDYGFPEGLLDVRISAAQIHKELDVIINPNSRAAVQAVIASRAECLKGKSEDMWNNVLEKLTL